MAESDRLSLREIRAAFRLLGECRELGADPVAWRRHMLEGLRQLTGAQLALYLHLHELGTDAERIAEPLDSGFLDESDRALWVHYQRENAHRDDPFHMHYFRTFTGSLRTRSLAAVVDMPEWRLSRHYNEYIRACRLDDRITSSVRLPEPLSSATQVIVLHRSASDRRYPYHAQRLVHLFHEELISLLGGRLKLPGTQPAEPGLPFQLEQVLRCLLVGESEKQVAARLGLSPHTVNRHIQRLYRRFDVHSRAELLFRCRDRLPRLLATDSDSR